MKYDSSERIRKALRHRIRYTPIDDLNINDRVMYKRRDNVKWRGPGKVIDINLPAKTILVRKEIDDEYVKVHAMSFSKIPILDINQKEMETPDIEALEDEISETGSQQGDDGNDNEEGQLKRSRKENRREQNLTNETQLEDQVSRTDGCRLSKRRRIETHDKDGDDQQEIRELNNDDQQDIQEPNNVSKTTRYEDIKNLQKNQRFEGTDPVTGEHIAGKILGRAGKVIGKNKYCFNVERSDGWRGWLDMTSLEDLLILPDETEMLVLYNNSDVSDAKEKEIKNWIKNDVFEEVEDIGQNYISVRWVITEKIKEDQTTTKARLVARGFEEDSSEILKDAPTCSREAVRILACISAAVGWQCNTVDVTSAYLQGDQINRIIFLKPPKEYYIGKLWKLRKTVYGLVDAARAWYVKVKKELHTLNVQKCKLDNSLFFWYNNGHLEGLICVYVDDFLWSGTTNFYEVVIKQLMSRFSFGNSTSVSFTYVGLTFKEFSDGITIDQKHYIDSLTTTPVPKRRMTEKESSLTLDEKKRYKALIGQLSWVATHTRPDIAFETSTLSSMANKASIANLMQLNKLVERTKKEKVELYFPRLQKIHEATLECFTDASLRNLPNERSQAGFIILLRDEKGRSCPLFWESKKIERVVNSTLAAETMALITGAQTSVFLTKILKCLIKDANIRVICFTDNRSLVSAIQKQNHAHDRKLRCDLLVLKEMLEKNEIHEVKWVKSDRQLANGLTKAGARKDDLTLSISRN